MIPEILEKALWVIKLQEEEIARRDELIQVLSDRIAYLDQRLENYVRNQA